MEVWEAPAKKPENMKEMGEKSQRLLSTGKKEEIEKAFVARDPWGALSCFPRRKSPESLAQMVR